MTYYVSSGTLNSTHSFTYIICSHQLYLNLSACLLNERTSVLLHYRLYLFYLSLVIYCFYCYCYLYFPTSLWWTKIIIIIKTFVHCCHRCRKLS